MKTTFVALLSSLFVASALAQTTTSTTFTINTPANAVVCQPLLITWSGGTPPYFLSALPGANPTGAAVVDFGQQSGNSLTWKVNVAQGTSLDLTIRDSAGLIAQTAPFTINPGTDTSCVGQSSSAGSATGGSTGTAAGSSAAAGTTAAGTTGGAVTTAAGGVPVTTAAGTTGTTTKPASVSTAAAASSAKPATTSNAASAQGARLGAAGILGAAVVALLA